MAHTLVQPHQHGGILERSMGSNAGLRKVDDALLCEDHAQLCDGVPQDDEDVAYGAPLLFAVFRRREVSYFTELCMQDSVNRELSNHRFELRCRLPGRLCREAHSRVDPGAPLIVASEQQMAKALPVGSVSELLRATHIAHGEELFLAVIAGDPGQTQ